MRYKVQLLPYIGIDNIYEVVLYDKYDNGGRVFQGSLLDCEAYIRLQEGGYM